jgi:hypothetical protein
VKDETKSKIANRILSMTCDGDADLNTALGKEPAMRAV